MDRTLVQVEERGCFLGVVGRFVTLKVENIISLMTIEAGRYAGSTVDERSKRKEARARTLAHHPHRG